MRYGDLVPWGTDDSTCVAWLAPMSAQVMHGMSLGIVTLRQEDSRALVWAEHAVYTPMKVVDAIRFDEGEG